MNILFFALLIILCILLIIIVVACTSLVVPHCCNCMRSLCKILKDKLMYNSVIRGVLEAYFLMSIAAVYQMSNTPEFDSEGKLNFTISIIMMIFLVTFPILSLWFVLRNFKSL